MVVGDVLPSPTAVHPWVGVGVKLAASAAWYKEGKGGRGEGQIIQNTAKIRKEKEKKRRKAWANRRSFTPDDPNRVPE